MVCNWETIGPRALQDDPRSGSTFSPTSPVPGARSALRIDEPEIVIVSYATASDSGIVNVLPGSSVY